MRTKLSPAEELRMERMRLREECQIHKDRILNTVNYIGDNWGSVLLTSIARPSKCGFQSLFGSPKKTKPSLYKSVFSALPTVWGIAQPFVIGWATKKLTSRIFGRKGKKRK